MPKTIQILCDSCGEDITSTGSMPVFRLCLSAEALPHTTKGIYTIIVHPPIKEAKYFCGISCLEKWLANKQLQDNTGEASSVS